MSGRGPDPKELRASLVDSGWSVAPPEAEALEIRAAVGDEQDRDDPSTRRLPNYEDLSQAPAVTQIDADIQSRLQQMQRASIPLPDQFALNGPARSNIVSALLPWTSTPTPADRQHP